MVEGNVEEPVVSHGNLNRLRRPLSGHVTPAYRRLWWPVKGQTGPPGHRLLPRAIAWRCLGWV